MYTNEMPERPLNYIISINISTTAATSTGITSTGITIIRAGLKPITKA